MKESSQGISDSNTRMNRVIRLDEIFASISQSTPITERSAYHERILVQLLTLNFNRKLEIFWPRLCMSVIEYFQIQVG